MKFLHTGDWHLGRQVRSHSRMDEFVAVLDEVVEIARDEQVDCVIIAGDTFDTFSPPPEAERLLYETLGRLLGDGAKVVLLAGNHDHAPRLDALASLFDLLNIHTFGSLPATLEQACVRITSRNGTEAATIAVLPWVPERYTVDFESLFGSREGPMSEYATALGARVEKRCALFSPDTVNIFAGHMLIDGAVIDSGGSERKLHIGQNFAVPVQSFPSRPQYVALGHVHKPQQMSHSAPMYYSGSLLQLDFGEENQQKSVNIVEAKKGLPATTRLVPITRGKELKTIQFGYGFLGQNAGVHPEAYLRVKVDLDSPVPNLFERVRELIPNAVDVMPIRLYGDVSAKRQSSRGMAPHELLERYFQAENNRPIDPPVLKLFNELYEQETRHASL